MRNFIALASLLVLLCGCAISVSTHSFEYLGTDSLRDDSNFFYVKFGVAGISSATYTLRGGGHVRQGLIAEAKASMLRQYTLGPNQAYINMSIDVIKTQTGTNGYGGAVYNTTTFTVVVSADVIEYGTAPENHQPIMQSAGLLPTDNSSPSGLLPTDTSAPNEITNNKTTQTEYSIGETVIYTKSNKSYDAVITDLNDSYYRTSVKIEYINESGSTKKRWVYMESLSKK